MKPTHYHTGVSGRVRFVTLTGRNKEWTSDGYKASTVDLNPIDELLGTEVMLNDQRGKIMDVSPDDSSNFAIGKYLGNEKYEPRRSDLAQENQWVRVYWYTGVQPVWQPVFKLKLL